MSNPLTTRKSLPNTRMRAQHLHCSPLQDAYYAINGTLRVPNKTTTLFLLRVIIKAIFTSQHASTCFIYEMEMYTLFCLPFLLFNPGKHLRHAKFGAASIRRIILMHLALCVCKHDHKIVYVIIDNIPFGGKFVHSTMGISVSYEVHSKTIHYSAGVQKVSFNHSAAS